MQRNSASPSYLDGVIVVVPIRSVLVMRRCCSAVGEGLLLRAWRSLSSIDYKGTRLKNPYRGEMLDLKER